MIGGHQQHIGAIQRQRQVVGSGGVHHLLRLTAADPGMLVIIGQHRGIPGAQPQAGRLFPPGAEPDRLGQLHEAERVGEQGQAAAVLHCLQLLGITGQDHLGAAAAAWLITSARSGLATMDASSIRTRSPGCSGTGPRAPRCPGRWPRNWAAL